MDAATRHALRREAIADTVAQVRRIEAEHGVTRESLARIREALLALGERRELFPVADFPLPPEGAPRNNALYRLSEDADHRFALYAHVSRGGTNSPAHDHSTWAVIAGLQGAEVNRLYDHDGQGGVAQRGSYTVGSGTDIAFMPDDLHSIHTEPGELVLNFHMYGLALEQLHRRRYYKAHTGEWAHFPASEGIRNLPQPA
jgi:predicted metal-dependent enzyme (double-stranded beta helix superfamily)